MAISNGKTAPSIYYNGTLTIVYPNFIQQRVWTLTLRGSNLRFTRDVVREISDKR